MDGFFIVAKNNYDGLVFVFSDYPAEYLFPLFTTDIRKAKFFPTLDECKDYANNHLSHLGYTYLYLQIADADY